MVGIEAGYAYKYHHGMWTELITLEMIFLPPEQCRTHNALNAGV